MMCSVQPGRGRVERIDIQQDDGSARPAHRVYDNLGQLLAVITDKTQWKVGDRTVSGVDATDVEMLDYVLDDVTSYGKVVPGE